MSIQNQVNKLKALIEEKLNVVEMPEKDDNCIVVRELIVGKSYNAEIAIGISWVYQRYYNVVGLVFEESKGLFIDSSMRMEAQTPKGTKLICGVGQDGLWERIDKAKIGIGMDEWNGKLGDLIKILESL